MVVRRDLDRGVPLITRHRCCTRYLSLYLFLSLPSPCHIHVQVVVRAGTCFLPVPLVLTELDSGIAWSSYAHETAVLSGGAPVSGLDWAAHGADGIMVATLPDTVDAAEVDQLFSTARAGPGADGSKRLVRARYPNGDSEVDRMPDNYDKLGGGVLDLGLSLTWA